jgi:hypothetical protein
MEALDARLLRKDKLVAIDIWPTSEAVDDE